MKYIFVRGGLFLFLLSVSAVLKAQTVTLTSSSNPACAGTAVTFTATVNPDPGTGTVDFYNGATLLGSGTIGAPGVATYTTSALAAGTHSITAQYGAINSAALVQTITTPPTANISYNGSPYCSNGTATVTLTGTNGGTYSSTAGLVIDAGTGNINLATSTPGNYTVTYTIAAAGGCPAVTATAPVTITAQPTASISYNGSPYCSNAGTATVTLAGTAGGTYSSTAGLSINSGTGDINLAASIPGFYTVTYTIAAANGCPAVIATANLSITALPVASIAYNGSPYCSNIGTATVTRTGAAGGLYSSTAGLSIDPVNGNIDLAASTPGSYTVTYTIAAANGCPAVITTTPFSIGTAPVITTNTPTDTGACRNNDLTLQTIATGLPAPTVQWQLSTDNGASWNNIAGATNPNYTIVSAGTNQDGWRYRAIYTNGCGSVTTNVTILRVGAPINIGTSSPNQTGCNGTGTVSFTASANGGNGLVTMMWQYSTDGINWVDIPGTTTTSTIGNFSTTYSFITTPAQNGYMYRAKFSNGGCAASFSTPSTLTVNPVPSMASQPASQVVCAGAATAPVNFSGINTTGFTWTNNTPGIGLAASGNGNIGSFTAVNSGSTPITATITVTPVHTGGTPPVTCPGTPVSFTITVNPAATVNAGANQTICQSASPAPITLTGASIGGGATTGTWWITAGSGTLSNTSPTNNPAGVTFTPAANFSGPITLTLTTNDPDGAGPCIAASATKTITVNQAPTAVAGGPDVVCQSSSPTAITLTGASVGGGATTGAWSIVAPGGGNLSSTAQTANPAGVTYTPPANFTGTVTLRLTTNAPVGCSPVTVDRTITVNPRPTATAGSNQTVCSSTPGVTLAGVVGGSATGGVWSGGTGTFNPNNTTLNAVYTPSAAEIAAGSVTLTLSTTGQLAPCAAATSTVTITYANSPTVTVNSPTRCSNGAAVTMTATPGSGNNYDYTWTVPAGAPNPGNVQSFTPTVAGTYTVVITQTSGPQPRCSSLPASGVFTILPSPTVTLNLPQAVCSSSLPAAITATPGSGAVTDYTFAWTVPPGATNPGNVATFPATVAGTYNVIMTNIANGCPANASGVLSISPAATVNAGGANAVCQSATPAPITLTGASVGGGATTGAWTITSGGGTLSNSGQTANPAAITFTPAANFSGVVTLTLTTNAPGSCPAVSATRTITVNALPVVNAGTYPAVCISGAPVTLSGSPAGGTFSGPGVTGTTFNPATAGVGPHTITYSYTDANGCSAVTTTSINVNALPVVSAGTYPAVCVNAAPVTLTGSPAGGTFSGPGVTANSFNPGTAGVGPHNITYTYTNANGCTNTATASITVNALPVVNAGTYPAVCVSAGAVTLTGSPVGGTFSGPGVTGNSFNPATAGVGPNTITYTYTDANGCTNSATASITVHALPVVSAGTYPAVCVSAAPVTLTGSPAGGTFSGPGVTGNSFNPATAGVGSHTITYSYTDANGCATTATVAITVNALPVVSAGTYPAVCVNAAAVTLTGSPVGGTFSGPGVTGNSFNPATAGVGPHTITYSYTDANGCSNTTTTSVTVNALPVVNAGTYPAVCISGAPVTLSGTPAGGTFSGPGVTGTTFNPATAGAGTHTITYSYTDANGCTATTTTTITVNPLPVVNAGTYPAVCVSAAAVILSGSPAGGTFSGAGVSGNSFNPATAGRLS